MTFLLGYTFKSSAIIIAALFAARLCRRQPAALRHAILAAAILGVAILPVAMAWLPAWNVGPVITIPAPPAGDTAELRSSLPNGPLPHVSGINSSELILPLFWWTGLAVVGISLLIGWGRIARATLCLQRVKEGPWASELNAILSETQRKTRITLLRGKNTGVLATWGLFRPKILIPKDSDHWSRDQIRTVLLHELAHVRRFDWAVQTTSELVRAIQWFNPVVWILCSRLRIESEFACDDAVLSHGVPGTKYAGHLLSVVRQLQNGQPWSSALAMARPSTIERRLRAMLNRDTRRNALTARAVLAIVGVTTCMALPLSTLSTNARIVQEPRRPVILRTPTPTPAPTPTPMTMVRAQRPQNVSPAPAVAAPVPPAPQGKTYSGELITLDLKNVDLKDFFKFISDLSGKNFVLDPGVNGTLTLQMRDVPWDQVLDIVMGNHNLAATLEGNVMRVRQAKDVITVDFDISRNGTRLSAPRISTVAGITATLMQDSLKITMMPTRLAPDRVSVDFEFSYGETVLKANVVLGNQDPATVTVRSGADSFALSIRLVVSK